MTAYYVDSAGDNSDGLTWAKAFTTFAGALTAATASGDVIYVDQGFTNTLASDAFFVFNNNISVICSNDKAHEPPQNLGVMGASAWIGHSSASYLIELTGPYRIYMYGITFRISGTASKSLSFNAGSSGHFELENCYLWPGSTSANCRLTLNSTTAGRENFIRLKNTTIRFGSANNYISINKYCVLEKVTIDSSGSSPNFLFDSAVSSYLVCSGCDFSYVTNTLFRGASGIRATIAMLDNCKLGSGVTVFGTQTPANKAGSNVWLYNCSSSDQHYHLAHYDSFGSTLIDTGIYANDGAKYDGTNGCSWKIVTTANCSYYTPYVSPWIDCYHSGTSAITPSLEVVRSGSATAYQDDEVWGEFSYQGTSGYPLSTLVNDCKGLLNSAADQTTGALGAGDWTGESGTSWFGKLNPTETITPAEIGYLRARVCVGEPSITIYVDPTIRGRS